MKTNKNLFHRSTAAAFAVVVFAMASSANAATFTWDGGGANNSWGTADNWDPNGAPTFDNTADLVFDVLTRPNNFIGTNRIIRSISYGPNIDDVFQTNYQDFVGGTARTLTMEADSGNASITVDADASGAITLGSAGGSGTIGTMILADNLDVVHNGSGLLLFNRGISGTGFGITKTGSGTMSFSSIGSSPNTFTGDVNVNAGKLIANGFVVATDINNAAKINLGGGTLEVSSISGANKDYNTVAFEVSSASTLIYKNLVNTNYRLGFTDTPLFKLDAALTVQNASVNPAVVNPINLNRNITGAGDMIVNTYNDITSTTADFTLGRVGIGGVNTEWSGDLNIRRGTVQVTGNYATADMRLGSGDIVLGTTDDSFGAGLLFAADAGNGSKAYSNNITVRSGGYRTIRGGSDHSHTFNGNIVLEGDLNVHNNLFFNDKHMILNGVISGPGDLIVTKNAAGGFTRLTGSNPDWSGDLIISQGTVNLFGTADTSGTGDIVIGATADATAAGLSFSHATGITYANDLIVNTGGSRTIFGNSSLGINVTFSGAVALNGDLTLDHSWSTADRRTNLNGNISGDGGLTITRTAGSTGTTARLAGTNTYTGATLVAPTASLALASTCSLTSNITVQNGARIGGSGSTTGTLNLESGANFSFFYSLSYVPMSVVGAVTLDNSFGIASLVGGSQGEVVPWATIPAGTYTLIATTASTFGNIQNFGIANAIGVDGGKTAYFQNGGGTSGGGLQLVVTEASDPYAAWSGGAAFNDDTNNDGIANGLAFLLGAQDVNINANGLLPAPTQSGGALTLTFSMRNAAARGTASLQVQHSSDLGITDAWSTLATVPDADGTDPSGIVFDITAGTPLNGVTATIPASGNAAGGKLFGRVKSNP